MIFVVPGSEFPLILRPCDGENQKSERAKSGSG